MSELDTSAETNTTTRETAAESASPFEVSLDARNVEASDSPASDGIMRPEGEGAGIVPEAAPEETVQAEPEPDPTTETAPTPQTHIHPLPGTWQAISESVVGLAHRRGARAQPCQDAGDVYVTPRLGLFVADGAGSSPLSDVGSRTAIRAMRRLCLSLDDQVATLLDGAEEPDIATLQRFALRCVWHVLGTLEDEAESLLRPVKDLRCTLSVMLGGKARVLWFKVGDGVLVVERQGQLLVIGSPQKGEFANQTRFVDHHLTPDAVEFGLLTTDHLSGLAIMTDGAAERLVAHDGSRVAGLLAEFLDRLRAGRFKRSDLTEFFYDPVAWRGTSGDDKTLALAAR